MSTAIQALKALQYVFMLFFIGMTTFPAEMMDGYQMDFSCPKYKKGQPACDQQKNMAAIFGIMAIFGVQMGAFSVTMGAMARDTVSKKAQSVACFMGMCSLLYFNVNDFIYTLSSDWPGTMPKEGVYFNMVLFAGLAALCYMGWTSTGSVTPNLSRMIPEGRFGKELLAGCLNLAFFGIPLVFFRSSFIDMYPAAAEPMKALTPPLKWFSMWMFGNLGKMILVNILTTFAICSVEKNDDTQYRLLRGSSLIYMFYLGSFSKDTIVQMLTGVDDTMRLMTFTQSFAVTYYQLNTWAGAKFTLTK